MNNNPPNEKQSGKIEQIIPSAIPLWAAGAIWILSALVLPMYKLSVILVTALISTAVALILKKTLPKETRTIEVPFTSGNEKLDNAIISLDTAAKRLRDIAAEISADSPQASETVNETASTLGYIRAELLKEPDNIKKLRRFFDFYLPTQIKLAEKYREMVSTKKTGENSMNTFLSAEKALAELNSAFKKQYDALFEDDSLDVESDIAVLDTMLKQDNLK